MPHPRSNRRACRQDELAEIGAYLAALDDIPGLKNEPRAVKMQIALAAYQGAKLDYLAAVIEAGLDSICTVMPASP